MDSDKKLAIELTKALLQNSNVKPVFNHNGRDDDSNSIAYILGDTKYTFSDITSHFLDNIKRINEWD
jgi:hypothetical protein